MNDFKSKLPDLKELSSMTSKLFNGLKSTVSEIIHDYKEKRAEEEAKAQAEEALKAKETVMNEPEVKAGVVTPAPEPTASVKPAKSVEPPPVVVSEEEKKEEGKE